MSLISNIEKRVADLEGEATREHQGTKRIIRRQAVKFEVFAKEYLQLITDTVSYRLEDKLKQIIKVGKYGRASSLANWNCLKAKGKNMVVPLELDSLKLGADRAIALDKFNLGVVFDIYDPESVRLARLNAAKLVTNVTEGTILGIRDVITHGIESGWSTGKMAAEMKPLIGLDRQRERRAIKYAIELEGHVAERLITGKERDKLYMLFYNDLKNERTKLISVTESSRAINNGTIKGYERVGIETCIWWADSNCCPICQAKAWQEYTVIEAQGMLPAHPSCECGWRAGKKRKPIIPSTGVPTTPAVSTGAADAAAWLVPPPSHAQKPIRQRLQERAYPVAEAEEMEMTGSHMTAKEYSKRFNKYRDDLKEVYGEYVGRHGKMGGMDKFLDDLKRENPAKFKSKASISMFSREKNIKVRKRIKDRLTKGLNERVAPYTHPKFVKQIDEITNETTLLISKQKIRANHAKTGKSHFIEVNNKATTETLLHEHFHGVEKQFNLVNDKSYNFLYETKGCVEQKRLADLTGNPLFGDEVAWEVGKGKTEFIDPYVGKKYAKRAGTEVISMGVQCFANKNQMRGLVDSDFDHFSFILGTLNGIWK